MAAMIEHDMDQDMDEGDDNEGTIGVRGGVRPDFPALTATASSAGKIEYRRIRVPPHRLTPLRAQWENLMSPIVEYLKLQIRFNPENRSVELKTSALTEDPGAIQKGQDFCECFMMGFEVQDAVAMLRLDDLFIDSFMVTDVKMLAGDHLSRAIGRVAGQDGKTRFAIENATRTRIVIADQKVHIMGSFSNIKLARDAICNLIIGAPPGKVYNQMRNVAKRMNERY
jgi:RNA-binding protein PNO1